MPIWIETSLLGHPKTCQVAEALGVDRALVVGHLAELWFWTKRVMPAGGPLSTHDVRIGAEWTRRKDLAAALIVAGFLDERPDGLWLHDGELLSTTEPSLDGDD